jgi:hypothetical protein
MSDRQYKAQLARLRRYKKKSQNRKSTSGRSTAKKKGKLPIYRDESAAEARRNLIRGKL